MLNGVAPNIVACSGKIRLQLPKYWCVAYTSTLRTESLLITEEAIPWERIV